MPSNTGRPRLVWVLVAANIIVILIVGWMSWHQARPTTGMVAFREVEFSNLPGWQVGDTRAALAAFDRSCALIMRYPKSRPMGGLGYAGTAGDWTAACAAIPAGTATVTGARAYFERWFAPFAVTSATDPLFTGYYEPMLSGSRVKDARFRVPIYGRPSDLVTADLSLFRRGLGGIHIYGRLSGTDLVPYVSRADIENAGLSTAPVLLYTDDPVSAFFLSIQGSGRVRFGDGTVSRLSFAGTNGRRYTSIGRVLVARGAIDKKHVSMQSIRSWLNTHANDAQKVMEEDQSYVFFSLAPLGDPSLGSPGTEGVPLTAMASVAVDPRVHAFGVPIFVATTVQTSDGSQRDQTFNRLLIAQDTGGDIRGASRFDVFFGADSEAEEIAGQLKSRGQFFVLLPKAAAALLASTKEYAEQTP